MCQQYATVCSHYNIGPPLYWLTGTPGRPSMPGTPGGPLSPWSPGMPEYPLSPSGPIVTKPGCPLGPGGPGRPRFPVIPEVPLLPSSPVKRLQVLLRTSNSIQYNSGHCQQIKSQTTKKHNHPFNIIIGKLHVLFSLDLWKYCRVIWTDNYSTTHI